MADHSLRCSFCCTLMRTKASRFLHATLHTAPSAETFCRGLCIPYALFPAIENLLQAYADTVCHAISPHEESPHD